LPGAQLFGAQFFSANGALAQEKVFHHGISVLGELNYPADFKHFDYVNPQAPKGGKLRLGFLGSFDTLNAFSIKGDPFVSAQAEAVVDDAYETLMTSPFDQPATNYGLIAEGISYPDDFSSATFKLRAEAKFHDGKAITAEDVVWTFGQLKKNLPGVQAYYRNVAKVEQSSEREVTFVFDSKGNRELPLIVGELNVLPKHWWTANDAKGKPRDISSNTLEPPLGSGPYRIVDVKPGQYVRMERVKDYWGKDLPVNVGRHNFDEVEFIMFKDGIVAFEAFKADQYDFRWENSSKQWATGYDFPGLRDGKVTKEEVRLENVEPIQAWVLNLLSTMRLILNGPTRTCFMGSTSGAVRSSTIRNWKQRACRPQKNWLCLSR
jgi:microcin C transport system substrate-binding protein